MQEVFADFQTVNKGLFNLDIPIEKTLPLLCNKPAQWSANDQSVQKRILDGIFGVLQATRTHPLIRYDSNSVICTNLAQGLQQRLDASEQHSEQVHLLFFDRKEDPVTPLLN